MDVRITTGWLLGIIACFVQPGNCSADTYSYQERIGDWVVSGDKDALTHAAKLCVAGRANKHNSRLGVAMAEGIEGVMIIISSNRWYKVGKGNIVMNASTDSGDSKNIPGAVIKSGKIHLNTDRVFLRQLRSANNVTFSLRLFSGSFSLKWSARALQKLLKCADGRFDMSDPLKDY